MKTTYLRQSQLLLLGFCLLGAAPLSSHAEDSTLRSSAPAPRPEEEPAAKAAAKKEKKNAHYRRFHSRNNEAVKIYPDMVKRDMHVVAKDLGEEAADFYVFDVQGTLVLQLKLKSRDHERISGLARGKYLFRVFQGDLETATGEFEIR